MKRDFLKGLGLEAEVIDKIMAEHGSSISKEKGKTEVLQEKLLEANKNREDLEEKLNKFKGVDVDKIKEDYEKEVQEWKEKFNNLEKNNVVNDFFKDYKFTSKLAEKATKDEFMKQQFELKDGKLEGADEFMKKFMNENKEAFIVEEPKETSNNDNNNINFYEYNPSSGNSNGSSDSFEASLDKIFDLK